MRARRPNAAETMRFRKALGWALSLAGEYLDSNSFDPMLKPDAQDKVDALRTLLIRFRRGDIVY